MNLNKPKIYVIILNYNNAKDTLITYNSLNTINNFDIRKIIVDNNSEIKCINEIRNHISNDDVFLETNENRGYAAGNNYGIRYAIKNGANYICILNNDVIVNKNSFDKSCEILANNNDVAFVAPVCLYNNTNVIQSAGINIMFGRKITDSIHHKEIYQSADKQEVVDSLVGACLLFKSDIIEKVGYLPENYILEFEETEWLYRAKSCERGGGGIKT